MILKCIRLFLTLISGEFIVKDRTMYLLIHLYFYGTNTNFAVKYCKQNKTAVYNCSAFQHANWNSTYKILNFELLTISIIEEHRRGLKVIHDIK